MFKIIPNVKTVKKWLGGEVEQHMQGLVTGWSTVTRGSTAGRDSRKDYAGLPGPTGIWGLHSKSKRGGSRESQICVYGA